MKQTELQPYLKERLEKAKVQFERTIDCKHTEFDDLYPYISEQPTFFLVQTICGLARAVNTC